MGRGDLVVAPRVGDPLALVDDEVHAHVRLYDGHSIFPGPGHHVVVLVFAF